jgi:hypothetical protein
MRKLISLVAAAGLFCLATGVASASSGGAMSFTTTAGTGLSVTGAAPGSLTAVTINGQTQTQYTSLGTYTGVDSTGTGAGWNVTFQATQFACTVGSGSNKCPTGGNSLPTGSLTVAAPTVACDPLMNGTLCSGQGAVPTISISANTAVDVASAVKVASAALNQGMGTYDFTPGLVDGIAGHNLKLVVPSWVYAGTTYNSTLTVSIGTGP